MTTRATHFFTHITETTHGCWPWTGATDQAGYGWFNDGTRRVRAHRWAYEHLIADIPPGLELDHLCRNTSCVNPWHLEPVTGAENRLRSQAPPAQNARRTVCAHGHQLTRQPSGRRRCRTCQNAANRAYRARKAVA